MEEVSTNYTQLPKGIKKLIGEFVTLETEFYKDLTTTSVPEWLREGRPYPTDSAFSTSLPPPEVIKYSSDTIPQLIGQTYTAPYPYSFVFEICRQFGGNKPYIRAACFGPFGTPSDRPIVIVPTGHLLATDPQEPYIVHYKAPEDDVSIPLEELRLLCPAWRTHRQRDDEPDETDWQGYVYYLFQDNIHRPDNKWVRIDHPDLARLQWIVSDFLVSSIKWRKLQLKRYLPLYPGNQYQLKVDQLVRETRFPLRNYSSAWEAPPFP